MTDVKVIRKKSPRESITVISGVTITFITALSDHTLLETRSGNGKEVKAHPPATLGGKAPLFCFLSQKRAQYDGANACKML